MNCKFCLFVFVIIFLFSCSSMHRNSVWYDEQFYNLPYLKNNYYNSLKNKKLEKEKVIKKESSLSINPLKIVGSFFIKIYQNLFSVQDGPSCQFYPSCSTFGIIAIKKYGLKGFLMTGDRLIRCNPYTYGIYPLFLDGDHHYDNVQEHNLNFSDMF